MHINNIPPSLAQFEEFVSRYEHLNFKPAETNNAVGNATINIVKGWMPFFIRPLVPPVMKCLLDDKMLYALNYTPSPRWLKSLVKGAMRLRALFLRKITFKKYPSFVTTESNRTYRHGYEIEQLGPENLVKNLD